MSDLFVRYLLRQGDRALVLSQQLSAWVTHVHDLEEEAEHVPLEEEVKDAAVILVAPDEDLCYGPDSLDQEAFIALCHCLVLGQHMINVICRAKPLQ